MTYETTPRTETSAPGPAPSVPIMTGVTAGSDPEPTVLPEQQYNSGSQLSPVNGLDDFFGKIRRTGLVRSQDRWVGGVAGGIAQRMGWDPLLVRGVLFVSAFLTGLGFVLYGLGWALLPEESDGRIHLQEALRGNFDVALVGAGLAVLAGLNRSNGLVGFGRWFAVLSNILTTALLAAGIVYVVRLVRERRENAATVSLPELGDGATFPIGTEAGYVPTDSDPRDLDFDWLETSTAAASGLDTRLATAVLPDDGQAWPELPDDDQAWPVLSDDGHASGAQESTSASAHAAQMQASAAAHEAKMQATASAHEAKMQAKAAAHEAKMQATAARHQAKAALSQAKQRAKTAAFEEPGVAVPAPAHHGAVAWQYAKALERSKKPVVRGPGSVLTGAVLGSLLLMAAAAQAISHFNLAVPAPLGSPLAWVGAGVAVIGAAIILVGFRGRRGGFLNLLAILGLLSIPVGATLAHNAEPSELSARFAGTTATVGEFALRGAPNPVGDGEFVVADRAQAELGFRSRFGDPIIDLTHVELPAPGGAPVTVPISLRAGDLTVVVPEDVAVAANVRLMAGDISWEVDDEDQSVSRFGLASADFESEEVGSGQPQLVLLIDMGVGNITVREGH